MKRRWVAVLLTTLLYAACSTAPAVPTATPDPTATPVPSPTLTPTPTVTLTPTPRPLTAATPAIVLEPHDPSPTPTPSLPAIGLPSERLSLLEPGPGSQATSPVRVVGWGGPSYRGRVTLRLIGEDGRVLARRIIYLMASPGYPGRFVAELDFEIPGVAEAARLEASIDDPDTARLDHVTSVDLILLATGAPLIHPALHGPERLAIFTPREGAVIQGGLVQIEGAGWVSSEFPLVVEVLDRRGEVVGSSQVQIDAPAVGQLGSFQVEVTYQIPFAQYGRIAVYERSPEDDGLIHYASVPVYLRP